MLEPNSLVVFTIICVISFSYLIRRLMPGRRPPLPPGPSVISFIKQALQASLPTAGDTYTRWAHKYGDIVDMSILGQHFIIINSAQTATDMLESKSSIYSNREVTSMIKLSSWCNIVTFMQPGAFFRQQRAYMHKLFGTQAALSAQHSTIEDESSRFVRCVLSSPENLADCVRHFAGSVVLRISYGYMTKEKNDPFISSADNLIREVVHILSLETILPWAVDLFPSLEKLPNWFPGTHFKKLAKQWSDDLQKFMDVPFQLVKEEMAAGTAVPSFTSITLADGNLSQEDERAIKLASMAIYAGGSDTTLSTIRGFFLAMALNPAVLRKAQEEIDVVVGTQRLPSISDRTHLPYVNALILELFRWIVVTPNGVPHKTSQDDVYAGYFIPKGSLVIPNIEFMMNDPRLYKDPERFMPERFLGETPEKDPRKIAFGYGRRICPGRLLADETVFIACAMSIAVFHIQKKVKDGVVVEPVRRMVPGFISYPEPYEIDVKPRSTQAMALTQVAAQA